MTDHQVPIRARLIAGSLLLLVQAAQLWVFFPGDPRVEGDNTRYEEAGFNLSTGHGLSLAFEALPDEDVREWACSRHPSSCGNDGLYPTAAYPAGYQFFIAGVYAVLGRSLRLLVLTQCLLHLVLMLLFENVAARLLRTSGYVFAMAVATTYPFLGRQAVWVMSDHLHAVLLFASIWAAAIVRPPLVRALFTGLLYAMATLTRPYSVVCLPVLLLWPTSRNFLMPTRGAAAAFAVGLLLPLGAWTGRNAYVFGHFIPFTTTGIGAGLYLNKTESTIGSALDGDNAQRIYAELQDVAGNITTFRGDRRLRVAAFEWLSSNWPEVLTRLPARAARVWVSMGMQGQGVHPQAVLLVLYLGGLLALGVAGLYLRGREHQWAFAAVIIVCYWAFLLHTPAEARRTLALRLPMLLFAGAAVEAWVTRFLGRRRARAERAKALPEKVLSRLRLSQYDVAAAASRTKSEYSRM